jgi:hypothetical protein
MSERDRANGRAPAPLSGAHGAGRMSGERNERIHVTVPATSGLHLPRTAHR